LSRSDFCGERVLEAAEATGLAYVSGINRYLCDRNAQSSVSNPSEPKFLSLQVTDENASLAPEVQVSKRNARR